MSNIEDAVRPELISATQAFDVGYKEAKTLREHSALPEHLDEQRELMERGYPSRRAPGVRFYADWRRGFEAGYKRNTNPAV